MRRSSFFIVGAFLLGLVVAPAAVRAESANVYDVKLKTVSLSRGVSFASSTRITLLPGVDVIVPTTTWSSASTVTILQTTSVSGTHRDTVVHLEFSDPSVFVMKPTVRIYKVCPQKGFGDCSVAQEADGSVSLVVTSTPVDVHVISNAVSYMRTGTASWYAYKKCRCAASPDFPKGTHLRVRLADTPSKYTIIRVNDFGPERDLFPNRAIDLDAVAFAELAPRSAGVIRVTVEPVSKDDPEYGIADKLPPGVKVAIKKTNVVKKTTTLTRK